MVFGYLTPGFVAAMNLELANERENLIYEKEYNLNAKPLEIDLLVIKKDRKLQISNEAGRLFRGHNIMEYKSPGDHLDIDAFYKSEAYACQKIVDELKGESSMCQALLEIMEPEINKIVESERKKSAELERKKSVLIAVKGFRDLGADDDKIIEILKRDFGLSMNEAGEYL